MSLALFGCASVSPLQTPDASGTIAVAPLEIDAVDYTAHWYVPTGNASALLLLEHGFARRCTHLHETMRELMAGGLMVLCVDASMAGGNPLLADALAERLAGGLTAPGGRALPSKFIVGGHSAGGAFSVLLGARLAALAQQRLAGAMLFDPVATPGFEPALHAVSDAGRRPVLAVLAQAHGCNAMLNAAPALRRVRLDALSAGREGFVGVQLSEGSTHIDVEGEDSDWIAVTACGQPSPSNAALLRRFAVQWAQDIARGAAPSAQDGSGWRLIE
jgi:pimeloyl-ACP methyl ester carboxylesterase